MQFATTFQVPDVVVPVLERVVDDREVRFIEALPLVAFSLSDARPALERATGRPVDEAELQDFLRRSYTRGVLRIEDESFTNFEVANLYERLEVFVVSQPQDWLAIEADTRRAIDEWYFETYCGRLSDDPRPTDDSMATLAETFAHIDAEQRPIWLNPCDCPLLAGSRGAPLGTCLSFRNGVNTMSHRGWSKSITKDDAKAMVLAAHRRGLMQTVNSHGLCNCCTDCCYLFRAQTVRGSIGVWPASSAVAVVDPALCNGCGACVRKCPFGVWTLESRTVVATGELCRGCGLCAAACRTGAMRMQSEAGPSTDRTSDDTTEIR